LGEAELNTIGYVISRYGRWSGRELEIQTHGEAPWKQADEGRLPGTSAPMSVESIRVYFLDSVQADRAEDPILLDSDEVRHLLAGAQERHVTPQRPDRREDILARLVRG
jgi:hypothetical protein